VEVVSVEVLVPAALETSEKLTPKRYVAGRRMQRDGVRINVGDEIPDAGTWKRLESWLRTGYVKEV
jgi:hypothetical protein